MGDIFYIDRLNKALDLLDKLGNDVILDNSSNGKKVHDILMDGVHSIRFEVIPLLKKIEKLHTLNELNELNDKG